jgi:hypothetical protein
MWGKRFIGIVVISFFYYLPLIPIIFGMTSHFKIELVAYAFLLLLGLIAAVGVYRERQWSWGMFTIVYALALANVLWVYYNTSSVWLFAITIVAAVVGFMVSVLNIKAFEEYEYYKYKDKVEKGVSEDEVIVEEIKPMGKKDSEPKQRRFLGSLKASDYHEPSCLAAKKIIKKNQVWFESKADADGQGYSRHTCVCED